MKCIPKHFHSFMRICIVDIAVKATIKIFSRSRNHMLQHVRYPFVDVPVIVNYVLIFICSKAKMVRAVFYIRRTISFSTNNDDLINVCVFLIIVFFDTVVRINNTREIKRLHSNFIHSVNRTVSSFFINVTRLFTGRASCRSTIICTTYDDSCMIDV